MHLQMYSSILPVPMNYLYLKKYAKPLLEEIPKESPMYCEAQRMLDFLKFFKEIPEDTCIMNNSILREFIGGSILVK